MNQPPGLQNSFKSPQGWDLSFINSLPAPSCFGLPYTTLIATTRSRDGVDDWRFFRAVLLFIRPLIQPAWRVSTHMGGGCIHRQNEPVLTIPIHTQITQVSPCTVACAPMLALDVEAGECLRLSRSHGSCRAFLADLPQPRLPGMADRIRL